MPSNIFVYTIYFNLYGNFLRAITHSNWFVINNMNGCYKMPQNLFVFHPWLFFSFFHTLYTYILLVRMRTIIICFCFYFLRAYSHSLHYYTIMLYIPLALDRFPMQNQGNQFFISMKYKWYFKYNTFILYTLCVHMM